MWDEEINKKIKEAADQYHPAYDDTAWNKMEQMLDEHLPLEKKRRRIIYLLPLTALFTGILFFVIFHKGPATTPQNTANSQAKNTPAASQNDNIKMPARETAPGSPVIKSVGGSTAKAKEGNQSITQQSADFASASLKKVHPHSIHKGVAISNFNYHQPAVEELPGNPGGQNGRKPAPTQAGSGNTTNDKTGLTETSPQTGKPLNEQSSPPGITDTDNTPKAKEISTPTAESGTLTAQDKKETLHSKSDSTAANLTDAKTNTDKQKKTKKIVVRNWEFGLSAGPDVSGVRLSRAGKITLAYGAQLSYSISHKFTLHTGFYVADKVYSADDADYYIPPGSSWSNYLKSIDGKCKVYEVPLTISYNFGKNKNHNWFASAGLSSYFMKKESYIYYYKNTAGVTWDRPWSVKDKNKHYFSVLDISAGYHYSISDRFSLTGEPYLKLPLSGVGAGRIKLNSAGILFTVAVKPF